MDNVDKLAEEFEGKLNLLDPHSKSVLDKISKPDFMEQIRRVAETIPLGMKEELGHINFPLEVGEETNTYSAFAGVFESELFECAYTDYHVAPIIVDGINNDYRDNTDYKKQLENQLRNSNIYSKDGGLLTEIIDKEDRTTINVSKSLENSNENTIEDKIIASIKYYTGLHDENPTPYLKVIADSKMKMIEKYREERNRELVSRFEGSDDADVYLKIIHGVEKDAV